MLTLWEGKVDGAKFYCLLQRNQRPRVHHLSKSISSLKAHLLLPDHVREYVPWKYRPSKKMLYVYIHLSLSLSLSLSQILNKIIFNRVNKTVIHKWVIFTEIFASSKYEWHGSQNVKYNKHYRLKMSEISW